MTAIPGTNVADTIVPFDSNDTFATHNETYGKGGWRSVQTIGERDSITSERRTEGMIVNVLANNQYYVLKNGITNSDWQLFTVQTSGNSFTINNVAGNVNNNLTLIGSPSILVSGNPLTNTILISAGSQVTKLSELGDVILSNVVAGQTLVTDGTYWYNADSGNISITGSELQGSFELLPNNIAYTVLHSTLPSITSAYPVVSVQTPSSGDNLLIANITNRSSSTFDVILSQIPNTTGYRLNWSLGGGSGGNTIVVNEAQTLPTSATFLPDYDNRYVKLSGDVEITANTNFTQTPTISGFEFPIYLAKYIKTGAATSVANTNVETSVVGTGVGSRTVSANTIRPGTLIKYRIAGSLGSKASSPGTLTMYVKFGSKTFAINCGTLPTSMAGCQLTINGTIVIHTIGATGTGYIEADTFFRQNNLTPGASVCASTSDTIINLDTTIDNTFDCTAQFSVADGNNYLYNYMANVEVIY